MMWNYGDHMSGWGWFVMGVSMLLFWGLLIVGVVLLVRHLGGGARQQPYSGTGQQPYSGAGQQPYSGASTPTPEQVLAQRFAAGEIDAQEYQLRLSVLRGGNPTVTKT